MASKLGTVFVELSLDDKIYRQKLSETLTSTTTTAKGIETSWKALGVKSNAIFEAQARAVQNAYTLIKNSATSTANDIIRAEEAKNAKLKVLNEQQFGHHTGLLEGLKKNWIAASAAIVAAWMLVNKAVSYMDLGAKAMQVESSFKIIAEESGAMSDVLIANITKATKGTVEESRLMQKTVKLLLAGYNPDQIERFSKVAITASQYMGTSVAESFDRISDALASRMPKAMVQSGAVTKTQMTIVKEAIAAGADEATLMELAITNLNLKMLRLQGTQDEATLAMQRYHAMIEELTENIGKGLIVMLPRLYAEFQYVSAGILGLLSTYARFKAVLSDIAGNEDEAAKRREEADAAWMARNDLIKQAEKNFFGYSEAEQKATAQEIAGGKAKVDSQMAGLKAFIAANKSKEASAKELERIEDQIEKELLKINETAEDAARIQAAAWFDMGVDVVHISEWLEAKIMEIAQKEAIDLAKTYAQTEERRQKEWEKSADEYSKMLTEESDFAMTTNEREINAIISKENKKLGDIAEMELQSRWNSEKNIQEYLYTYEQMEALKLKVTTNTAAAILERETENAKKIADINYSSIQGIRGMEQQAYDLKIKQINAEAAKRVKDGGDAVAVAQWVKNEQIKAFIELGQQGESVAMGIQAAWLQMYQDQMTWGKAAYEETMLLVSQTSSAFSNVLFAGIKTGTFDISDAWQSMCDTMLKKTLDIIAQMTIEWLMFGKSVSSINVSPGIGGQATTVLAGGQGGGGLVGVAGKLLGMFSGTVPMTSAAELASLGAGEAAAWGMEASSEAAIAGAMENAGFSMVPGVGWALGGLSLLDMFTGGGIASGIMGGISDAISSVGDFFSDLFHEGGIVGEGGHKGRAINPMIFAGAPYLHGGLMPDEFPAILQRGERVTSRNEVARETKGVTINLYATVTDKQTMNDFAEKIDYIINKMNKRTYS